MLLLVSMVSVLALQGFGYSLSLFNRVNTVAPEEAQQLIAREWFRGVNQSLVAKESNSLVGTDRTITSTTLNSFRSRSGVEVEIVWRLEEGMLIYEEKDEATELISVGQDANFRYLTKSGIWVGNWRSPDGSLPRAIKLVSDETEVSSVVRVRLIPNLMLEESRKDRG